MAKSAPKLFNSSSFPVLEVAATLDAPKTCFASCRRQEKIKKKKDKQELSYLN
jgi:hypothetical protein